MDNINLKNFGEIISTEEYLIDKEKKVVAQFNYKGKDIETKYTTGDILISATYIKDDNNERNEVIVGEEKELYKKEVEVRDINLLLFDEISHELEVEVKTRYSSKSAKAKIRQNGDKIKIVFDEPQRAITPGQSAVFYLDDIVVGGGKII